MSDDHSPDATGVTRRELVYSIGAGLLAGALPACSKDLEEPPTPVPQPDISVDGLLSASAAEQARAVRQGAVSSEELVKASLQRIEAINPQINAIVHLRAEDAMADARRADQALAAGRVPGPLHGVPMTLKDSIDTAGVITTYGSLGRSNYVPEQDATVAARLKAAGAILLGKTNTPEMTLSFETDNLVYGRTKNPFDTARSPGGSSGGAAAAVTSALCAFDIGSDTGGSIRVPSHFCGTAGIKPTSGHVPRTGHAASFGGIHDSLTQLGPIARSVGDLELILRVIAGPDGRDPFVAPVPLRDPSEVSLQGLRVCWHTDNGIFTPTPGIQAAVSAAVGALTDAGAVATDIIPPPMRLSYEDLDALFVWNQDGGAWIQRMLDEAGTLTAHRGIAAQIDQDYLAPGGEITRLMEARDRFRSDMLAFMQDYDALITPVAGFPAPLYGQTEDESHFPGYTYTWICNLTGWPAAVVRCGTSPEGLPIGVQIAAQPWREDVALAVAKHLEGVLGGWSAPTLLQV